MKKRILALLLVLGSFALQGSNGAQISGSGCGRAEAPLSAVDSDLDGLADALDNCPNAFNPHQTDLDGDGIGEICEEVAPFDGKIACELPSCEGQSGTDQCNEFLEQNCAEDKIELSFLGLSLSCCDRACVILEDPQSFVCPSGSCPYPFVHCSSDAECQEAGISGVCVEGCCAEIGTEPCEPCECPPEEPECQCPPCQCPDGGFPPQCEGGEGCPEGQVCDEFGCCLTEEPPPPPPPPPP